MYKSIEINGVSYVDLINKQYYKIRFLKVFP